MAGLNAGGQQSAGDDGAPDPRLAAVLSAYANGRETEQAALGALSRARLLVPLVEREAGPDVCPRPAEHGQPRPAEHDRREHPAHDACAAPGTKEMAFPTLIGRDGRPALLAFTSLDALARWRPDARPVPAPAGQVWGSAVADSCAVVIDVAGPVPLAVDGARLGALASGEPPPAPQDDPDVHAEVTEALAGEPAIVGAQLAPGSDGPEGTDLAIRLTLRPAGVSGEAETQPVQRAAQAIAARLVGRLRRGIEVSAVPAPGPRR
ncbi:MAG: SseB family protein [Streptosporangiaceae bacterium]